jgi:hypothetical protein
METSEEIKDVVSALVKVQGGLHSVKKDTKAYNYYYATLSSIWDVIREPLAENGLFVTQDALTLPEGISVTTRVVHSSGQWIQYGPLVVPMGKKDAHSTGSGITYGRRYALAAALGIVTDDDDGQAAQKTGPSPTKKAPPKVKPFSDTQVDSWVEKWSEHYDLCDLEEYCQARAKHLKHSVHQTCAELAEDEALFKRNIDTWLKQRQDEGTE